MSKKGLTLDSITELHCENSAVRVEAVSYFLVGVVDDADDFFSRSRHYLGHIFVLLFLGGGAGAV